MNKLEEGFSVRDIFLLFYRNIKLFLIAACVIVVAGISTTAVINVGKYSAIASVLVNTELDGADVNYETKVLNYTETVTGILTDDSVLKNVSGNNQLSLSEIKGNIVVEINGAVIQVTYNGNDSLDQCINILNEIIDSWTSYVNSDTNNFIKMGATLQILSNARENSASSNTKYIVLVGVCFIGVIFAALAAVLKSIYSKKIIDEAFVYKYFNKEVVSNIKFKKENNYEYEKLILKLVQKNSKKVLFTGVDSENKNKVFSKIVEFCKEKGMNVKVVNYDSSAIEGLDNRVLNPFRVESEMESIVNDEYDLLFINSNQINSSVDAVAVSGYVDTIVLGIEINKSTKKNVSNSVQIVEKINEDIIGVVYK